MPYTRYIILNNFPVCREYEITDLFHRTWAIQYVTQYYFISPRVLGYHHSFVSQAMLFPIVLLRRLMIIVLYRTYSWQPSKFNNGFNSYTKINHLRHILPYTVSLQRNMLPLQYSDILKARSNTPVKVSIISHWIRVERLFSHYQSSNTNFAIRGEYVISIAYSLFKEILSFEKPYNTINYGAILSY